MSDLISRQKALDAIQQRADRVDSVHSAFWEGLIIACSLVQDVPSAESERRWIPVTEALPEEKDWYLGIFKESDTGYCISVPFVCYYAGRKTMITTKDYWILRGYDDIYFSEYYRNLECAAWMPLPEPWRGE